MERTDEAFREWAVVWSQAIADGEWAMPTEEILPPNSQRVQCDPPWFMRIEFGERNKP